MADEELVDIGIQLEEKPFDYEENLVFITKDNEDTDIGYAFRKSRLVSADQVQIIYDSVRRQRPNCTVEFVKLEGDTETILNFRKLTTAGLFRQFKQNLRVVKVTTCSVITGQSSNAAVQPPAGDPDDSSDSGVDQAMPPPPAPQAV